MLGNAGDGRGSSTIKRKTMDHLLFVAGIRIALCLACNLMSLYYVTFYFWLHKVGASSPTEINRTEQMFDVQMG